MAVISKSALVQHSAAEMFALVDDVSAYADFLPWCGGSEELSRSDDEVNATVVIAHSGLNKAFTTKNRLQRGKMIEVSLVNGPFKHLHGFWRFESLADNACKVSLDLEYEFSNRLIGMVVGPVFNQIANTLVDSFCQRAEVIYGR
ncbi:MAG: type II toxin-antitoxin system RatA family toxin [Gammaproteobacteria bacterium]|nr:type II toxin-antitoxin system RatA family toxin [Gammaproteobacteria bacterium]